MYQLKPVLFYRANDFSTYKMYSYNQNVKEYI